MDENKIQSEEKPAQPVKYATPLQRLWAWVGVAYMILLVLLSTYALSHGDYLRGIGGIMVSPALCGLGATAILRHRQGVGRGGLPACVLVSGASFLLAVWNVTRGLPALLAQL
ncbi:MAG: hypothetical protein HFF06_09115 [Oscillospiraceae bacterium]|jgi:hypothetical protein|nr:hypothetical protein [Oscillospiraceae bacterium]